MDKTLRGREDMATIELIDEVDEFWRTYRALETEEDGRFDLEWNRHEFRTWMMGYCGAYIVQTTLRKNLDPKLYCGLVLRSHVHAKLEVDRLKEAAMYKFEDEDFEEYWSKEKQRQNEFGWRF